MSRVAALSVALSVQVACNGPSTSDGDQPASPPPTSPAAAPAAAPPSPSPAAPAPAPAAGPCARITAAEASATLELPNLRAPRQLGDSTVTVCQYMDGRNHPILRIYYQTGASKSGFASSKKAVVDSKQKPAHVAGLGEMAFSTTTRTADQEFNTIVFLHEGTQTSISAPAPLAKVKLLARQVLGKLQGS